MMKPEEIESAAGKIIASLTSEQLDYIRSESMRRTDVREGANTPFSCLHDLIDANELLPETSIDWDAEGGPNFNQANAIMDAFNYLCIKGNEERSY